MQAANVQVRVANAKDALRIRQIIQHSAIKDTLFFGGLRSESLKQVRQIVDSMKRCSWLLWDGGLFLVVPVNDNTAEVHVAVLPKYRGEQGVDAAQIALHMVFTRTRFALLLGRCPIEERHVAIFASMVGMKHVRDTALASIYSLSFFDWVASREDPSVVLAACSEYGTEPKAEMARKALSWITRGEIFPEELKHGS